MLVVEFAGTMLGDVTGAMEFNLLLCPREEMSGLVSVVADAERMS